MTINPHYYPIVSKNNFKNSTIKSRNPNSYPKVKTRNNIIFNGSTAKKLWLAHPIAGNAFSQLKQLLDHSGTERGMCLHYTNISFAANQCGSELVAFNAALALGLDFELS